MVAKIVPVTEPSLKKLAMALIILLSQKPPMVCGNSNNEVAKMTGMTPA